MTQKDRDRLVALKKARKGLITQREAAAEVGQSERHVRRLLAKLKKEGDRAVVHRLRGRLSNRRTDAKVKQRALEILSRELYRGFGPTLAGEYLSKDHDITVSRETVRSWMTEAKLWRVKRQRIEKIHEWRPRRSRQGELVQWDTSEHAWLEKRGPRGFRSMSGQICRIVDTGGFDVPVLRVFLKRRLQPFRPGVLSRTSVPSVPYSSRMRRPKKKHSSDAMFYCRYKEAWD